MLQKYATVGFMNFLYLAPAYAFEGKLPGFDEERTEPITGIFPIGKEMYKPYVFEDEKRDFFRYAFRFANDEIPKGQAVKAGIPIMPEGAYTNE
jgi:hypothetical protein